MNRILVTGVGAVIGYGILRTLKQLKPAPYLVGMDIFADAAGQHWCDQFVQSCLVSDPGYDAFLRDVISTHAIDLVIPGIEQDMSVFARQAAASQRYDARIALNSPALIELADDKWRMHQALVGLGAPAIPSRIDGTFADLAQSLGLPFLLKPRHGYAGKGIVRIRDERDFIYHGAEFGQTLMAQRIVGRDDAEFTISGFGDGRGGIGQLMALQRRLSGEGATAKAKTVSGEPFQRLIDQLAQTFHPLGPTNFQFRVEDDTPYLLEINPRISSATSIRCAFGYNEAAACIDYYLHGRLPDDRPIRSGTAVRYIEDIVSYDGDHL